MRIYLDIPNKYQIMLQEPATPFMIGICDFNDQINFYLIFIFVFISFLLIFRICSNRAIIWNKWNNHSTLIEFIWTLIPAIILIFIAIPSFQLLYALDEIFEPQISVKIKGAQWYWNYEISDIDGKNINFDSYTLSLDDINQDSPFRLLNVDNPLFLPIHTPIRLLITAEDVIHSFTIPSFGIKVDAIPGRLNSSSLFLLRPGLFFGQCSELCGQSHYNMSIVICALPISPFLSWLASF